MGRQLLLPRCYQNTPYQEHLGAPSLTPYSRFFAWIGLLRSVQMGAWKNYESAGSVRLVLIDLGTVLTHRPR